MRRVGEAGGRVFRRGLGHGDDTLDEGRQRCWGAVGAGGGGLALADQHAQADILALAAFHMLQRAAPPGYGEAIATNSYGVGGVGAGGARLADQVVQDGENGIISHAPFLEHRRDKWNRFAIP